MEIFFFIFFSCCDDVGNIEGNQSFHFVESLSFDFVFFQESELFKKK